MLNLLFQVFLLIVKSVAGFFCVLLLVRFYMQVFRVSFANRFGNFVVQLTNWLVAPLRRISWASMTSIDAGVSSVSAA